MASFARSLKPSPAYLSPCRRPVPVRSLSSSSDLSVSSAVDDSAEAATPSAAGTPSAEPQANKRPSSLIPASKPVNSGPIAIELPKLKKLNAAAPVYTPPEPLSARGDLPGGYFPMHEDPRGRIHHPHPFHQDAAFSRHHPSSDLASSHRDRHDAHACVMMPSMAHASMPVASYLAPGFHDSPQPLGKYYPSNYEQSQRTRDMRRSHPPVSESLPLSARHDAHAAKHPSHVPRGKAAEAEARRKMQQYQRDMIAQASMALGGSSKVASKAVPAISLGAKSIREAWLTGPSHKPASPRLHPLGSPGPVTPMDLEPVSAGGYLEHGKQDWMSKDVKVAMAAVHSTRSL